MTILSPTIILVDIPNIQQAWFYYIVITYIWYFMEIYEGFISHNMQFMFKKI